MLDLCLDFAQLGNRGGGVKSNLRNGGSSIDGGGSNNRGNNNWFGDSNRSNLNLLGTLGCLLGRDFLDWCVLDNSGRNNLGGSRGSGR